MKNKDQNDIREKFLRWLLFSILVLLLLEMVLISSLYKTINNEGAAYYYLITLLILLCAISLYFTLRKNYESASYLTMLMTIMGTWGAVIIEYSYNSLEFFPIIFVSLNVVFSSILLPLSFTILLSIFQVIGVYLILISNSQISIGITASFVSFILMISVLSIITSYINKVYIRQLKENSIKDHLTGLFNRRYFDEILDYWIQKAHSKKNTFGVILIDVDNFKSYNDTYGHHSGDKLLQYISAFLVRSVDLHDIVCRYGGDEFAIIITEPTHEFMYEIASSITSSINEIDFSTIGFGFNHVTLSMGLAFFPVHGLNRTELMRHADKNLMRAKEMGKNQVVF